MVLIDSHMHVKFMGYSAEDIVAYMDRNGIDRCWLLTWEQMSLHDNDYVHLSIEEVFEAYRRYPSKIVPMYAPDPSRPDAAKQLRIWYNKGARGCGELKVPLDWDSAILDPLLLCVAELDIPIVFHLQSRKEYFTSSSNSLLDKGLAALLNIHRFSGLPRKTLQAMARVYDPLKKKTQNLYRYHPGYLQDFTSLERRLKEYPRINFIGHGPLFWKGISSDFKSDPHDYPKGRVLGQGITCKLLSQYSNLYADLSGPSGFGALVRDRKFAKYFLSKYEHKILYGTDNFSLGLKEFIDSLELPKGTCQLIYGDNAAKLVK